MRQFLAVIAAISTLLLAACNQIEHRSEAIKKRPLPALTQSQSEPRALWTATNGTGTTRGNSILRLAVTPSTVVSASSRGHLLAQERRTGRVLWEFETNMPITGGPTIVSNHVLVGTRDKGLFAYNLQNGQQVWQVNISGEIIAAPAGNRDRVFVHAMDGSVSAVSVNDGHIIWRHSLSTPPIVLRHSSSPAFAGNYVIVGFSNGRLLALDRMDGSIGWERELSHPKGRSDIQRMSDISADPIVQNGIIYAVSYQGRLAALKADSGNPLWEREMSSYAGFALSNNMIFVADAKGHIVAVDRRNGKTIWEQAGLEGRRLSRPEVFAGNVVVGDDEGYLHWVSSQDGAFINRVQVDKKGIEAPPVVSENILYVLGRGGKIAAFNANNVRHVMSTTTDTSTSENISTSNTSKSTNNKNTNANSSTPEKIKTLEEVGV